MKSDPQSTHFCLPSCVDKVHEHVRLDQVSVTEIAGAGRTCSAEILDKGGEEGGDVGDQ